MVASSAVLRSRFAWLLTRAYLASSCCAAVRVITGCGPAPGVPPREPGWPRRPARSAAARARAGMRGQTATTAMSTTTPPPATASHRGKRRRGYLPRDDGTRRGGRRRGQLPARQGPRPRRPEPRDRHPGAPAVRERRAGSRPDPGHGPRRRTTAGACPPHGAAAPRRSAWRPGPGLRAAGSASGGYSPSSGGSSADAGHSFITFSVSRWADSSYSGRRDFFLSPLPVVTAKCVPTHFPVGSS